VQPRSVLVDSLRDVPDFDEGRTQRVIKGLISPEIAIHCTSNGSHTKCDK